ncbi:hypothetical protein Y1Q_0016592 [Alligator mississippiensis]|uniref:Sushi domain-containing protein n=1 Tax=Alligator mississippiensis TaxID=8496 RepID=A0A151MJQ3_ALLMI|nr:hypothetical protein Y1Q_0016592 [Alligator mississippiensis]
MSTFSLSGIFFSLLFHNGVIAEAFVSQPLSGGCDSPPRLTFAELIPMSKNMTDFPIGTVVIYACRPGYKRFPGRPPFMKCLAHGQWPEVLEFCERKACRNPGELHNGRIAITDVKLGATVNYTCDRGYRLIGKSQRRCDISGKGVAWSHEPPICERIPCPRPPDVKHGSHNAMYREDFSYGSAVIYTCDRGYPLTGESTIYCTTKDGKTGEWSGPGPQCGVRNGKRISDYKSSYAYGDTVLFECNPGYIMRGQSLIHCNAGNSWDPPVPVCEQANGCTTPAVQNGRLTEIKPAYSPRDYVTVECDPGYTLSSLRKAQCQVGGTWDPPVPACERVLQCPAPPRIAHADRSHHNLQAFTTGVSVTYECHPGYTLIGSASIYCMASGQWSIYRPRCEVTRCPNPEIRNGRKLEEHGSVYDSGDKVSFECNDGYVLKGSYEIQCRDDGTWAPPAPTCSLVVPCPPPPAIDNGEHTAQGLEAFHTGMSVVYNCDRGYSLFGRDTIHCTESGTWSLPYPRCTNGCGPPPRLRFAAPLEEYATQSSFPIGKIVKYSCQPGYNKKLWTPPSVKCLSSGEWTDVLEFCRRKSCGHPEEPQNGRVIVQSDILFGATVNYTCEEGHRLVGQPQRHCQISGKTVAWSGATPICERIPCHPPPDIEHGSLKYVYENDFFYGSSVTYKCDRGYPLIGKESIYCTTHDGQSGEWSGPAPRCGEFPAHSCPIAKISNGRIVRGFKSTYNSGDTVTIACNNGYIMRGQSVISCQPDNSWRPPVPVCEQVVKCLSPPSIANGKLKGQASDTFVNGTSAFYYCNSGYTFVGKASIQCLASGSWSRPYPQCEMVICPNPEIKNGRKLDGRGSAYTFGHRVSFECNAGYVLNGSHEIQCQQDGSWDPRIPSCIQALLCPPPPPVTNARHSAQLPEAFPSGTSVRYSCEPGYALIGKASIHCTASGTWSLPYPACSKSCGVPPQLSFAELWSPYKTQNGFLVGKTVNYTCLPGYFKVPENPQTVTCLENQTWSEALEFCKRKSCAQPEDPENGRVSIIDLLFESRVNYTCNEGYVLVGQLQRHCEVSGKRVAWSGDAPTCRHIKCPQPPDIQHGNHDGHSRDGFYYASVVTYTCSEGYPLTGEFSVHCTTKDGQTGVWSGPAPRCGEVRCPVPQIQNGRSVSGLQQVYTYGDTVTFECDPSYTMRGHNRSRCQSDDTWDPPVPVCKQVLPCPPPPPIANAKHRAQVLEVFPSGTSVSYSCDHGYFLVGEASIHCTESGTWSLPYPVCSGKSCGHPEEPRNGRVIIVTDLLFGSTVNYTCEEGYKLTGMPLRRCEISGQRVAWSGSPPECQRIVCPSPPDIHNGTHNGHLLEDFSYGSSIRYTCDPGHPLNGENFLYCTTKDGQTGVWSGPAPRCGEPRCPPPPSIANGNPSDQALDTFNPGSVFLYSCKPGYALVGVTSIQCMASGAWSRPLPRCTVVGCKNLHVDNGRIIGFQDIYRPGDIIVVACDHGYVSTGAQESQCQFGGEWDPPVANCERVLECPPPPNIANAERRHQAMEVFTPGMSVEYFCDAEYSLVAEGSIFCTAAGTWSLPLPLCEVIRCTNPKIQNGRKLDSRGPFYKPWDVVMLECNAGYSLSGSYEIQCGEDGVWDPPVPTCILAGCEVPKLHNGRILGLKLVYNHGDSVTVDCDPGYTVKGTPVSQCQVDGMWDPPVAVCEKVTCGSLKVQNGKATGTKPVHNPRDTVTVECDAGYAVNGTHESQCQDDGTWDPPVLLCERVPQCPLPPNITHAEHSSRDVETFTPGMSVNYSCEPGYSLVGEGLINCTTSGAWSLPLPRCEAVTCLNPEILNGRNLDGWTTTYSPGDSVRLKCSAGYSLNGSREIVCGEDGAWHPPVPVCNQAVTCPNPEILNGRNLDGWTATYSPGDSVRLECSAGYSLNGSREIVCGEDGAWHPPVSVCNQVTCGSLKVQNGKATGAKPVHNPRDTVTVECDAGYAVNGTLESRCQDDGTWDPPVLVCLRVVFCTNPEILNGRKLAAHGLVYRPGDHVQFECSAGYSLNGSHEIWCGEDGAWDPPLPACNQELPCSPPPAIANGKHSAQALEAFPSGMSVNYSCDPGYSLVGEASIHCTESGNWSLPFPLCAAIVCRKPEVQNGRILELKPVYNPRDTVTVECDPGYTVSSTRGSRCQDDGTWDPQVLTCEKVPQCPLPPKITHAKHSSQDVETFPPGMSVNYSCEPGYSLVGEGWISCTASGAWSLPLPHCEAITCTNPEIHDGRKLDERGPMYKPGDRVQFECSAGYSLNGSREIQCGEDGAWDPAIPVCSRVVCGTPNVPSGRISGLKPVYNPRDTVTVECDLGYAVNGTRESRCQNDGTWDPPVPICKRVPQCHLPPNITHAKHSSQDVEIFPPGVSVNYSSVICTTPEIPNGRNLDGRRPVYRPGDRVRVECNDMLALNGIQEIRCMENGTWDPPIPDCSLDQPRDSFPPMKFILKHQCPSPPTITNGKHSGQDLEVFTPGVSVNYSCEPGFSLAGETSIHCTASGTWNQPFPSCKGCAAPPAIANGNGSIQDSKEFAYGSSVTHSCDMGFLLIGEATSQCTSSGTWVPPIPYCKEMRCVVPDVPGIGKAMMGMTYPIGTNLTIQCDDDYMLEGSSLIQCQDDLSWDPPLPVCSSAFPSLGSYSAISAVTGVSVTMLLVLLVMGIVWRVASKKKEGYYHTYENYDHPIPMTVITDQKSSFAP